MDQFLEVAEQRSHPSPVDGAGAPRLSAVPAVASAIVSPVADLPALLLGVLPLVQAIDWLEGASASTMQSLAALSTEATGEAAPTEAPIHTPLLSDLMIEQALAGIEPPQHHTVASALVYAADIQPLSLTIDVGDLFADAGALAEVTPRATTAGFVANVENDIFGREMNVADTPLREAPKADVAGGVNPADTTDGPFGPGEGSESAAFTGANPDSGQAGSGEAGGLLLAYASIDAETDGQTFLVVDNSPAPLPKGGDILP